MVQVSGWVGESYMVIFASVMRASNSDLVLNAGPPTATQASSSDESSMRQRLQRGAAQASSSDESSASASSGSK